MQTMDGIFTNLKRMFQSGNIMYSNYHTLLIVYFHVFTGNIRITFGYFAPPIPYIEYSF